MKALWKGQGTLVAHIIKTPESGSAAWILFMNSWI